MDISLLAWVDREVQVAYRVGLARIQIWTNQEGVEQFSDAFHAGAWERHSLKLI
jgi:hypothetical protein